MSLGDPKGDLFAPDRLRGNWGGGSDSAPKPAPPKKPSSAAVAQPRPRTELADELRAMIETNVEGAHGRFMQHALSELTQALEHHDDTEISVALNTIEDLLDETVIKIR